MAVIVGQGISVSPVPDAKLSHESTGTVQNKAVADAIAAEYSTSKTYSVGDVCTHDGKLYECIVDIPTAEGWTLAHWKVSNLGDNVSNLNRQLNDLGNVTAFKAAILQLAQKVAYTDEHGQDYYDAIYDAFYPQKTLASISAVFTQGQTVIYDTAPLDSLKPMLVVTATYTDSTAEIIPSANYSLSGTLEVGTSTITASYMNKTATFTVLVTDDPDTTIKITMPNKTIVRDTTDSFTYMDSETVSCSKLYEIPASNRGNIKTFGMRNGSWNTSARYSAFFGDNNEHLDYNAYSLDESAEANLIVTTGSVFVQFAVANDNINDCYAYFISSGDIIFAGRNTKYYGMHNISELT